MQHIPRHLNGAISVCSPHYGFGPDSISGGGVYERELLSRIGNHDIEVDILLAPQGHAVDAKGIHVQRIKNSFQFALSNTVSFYQEMRRHYHCRPFDLVRAHDIRAPWMAGVLFHHLEKSLPVVLHVHHLPERALRLIDFLLKRFSQSVSKVIVPSQFTAQQVMMQLGFPEEQVLVVPNGIDTDRYSPNHHEEPFTQKRKAGRFMLLYVGSLIRRKNLFFLCDVVNRLRKRHSDLVLVIAGKGSLTEPLKTYVREKGLEQHVRLVGNATEEEKCRLYAACDLFVFPSLLEGFGLAPAEAMACGKPVVVSRGSALEELVEDGSSGLLANPVSADEFCERIEFLINHEAQRSELGKRARESIVRRFNWENTAATVAQSYIGALS